MHPTLGELLARARLEDDHGALAQPREQRLLTATEIVLRPARAEDRDEVASWGDLPTGPVLIAEVDGRLAAAASIGGEELVAHPTRPVADAAELLALRARQFVPS